MSYLAEEIKKYYCREGRGVKFANGMSLNQLAWEMWEKLNWQEIDPSVISRVLAGKRTFSNKQLKVFCQALNLDGQKQNKLMQARSADMTIKYGMDMLTPKIEYAQLMIPTARKFREKGFYDMSEEVADEAIDRLATLETETATQLLSQALFEKIAAIMDPTPGEKIYPRANPYLDKLYELGKTYNDPKITGLAHYLHGTCWYNLCQHEKAYKYNKLALELLPKGYYRPFSLRSAAISAAWQNNNDFVKKAEWELLSEVDNLDDDFKAVIYEGLARAHGRLKNYTVTENYLARCQNTINRLEAQKGANWVFRKLQSVRTQAQLFSHKQLKNTVNARQIKKEVKKAKAMAETYNFQKYILQFDAALEKLGN